MRGRKHQASSILAAILLVALAASPALAQQGNKGNSRGSAESKTNEDNNANGGHKGNSNGSTESKTNEDNNSNGSTESKTNEDNASKGSKGGAGASTGDASSTEKSGDAKESGSEKSGGKKSPVPGNNGTIKIDGEPFDTTTNNEPHVGCDFRVLYFGTDEEEGLTSTLTFTAHAPTSGDFTYTDTVTVGAADPDIAGPYNLVAGLEAAGIEPHPQQGYHVKLTTNTEYSQGADVKHKVFWIQCDETETAAAVSGSDLEDDTDKICVDGEMVEATEGVEDDGTCGHLEARSNEGGATVLGASLSREGSEVAGASAERGPSVAGERAEVAGVVLPFTGGEVATFLVIALVLVAAGVAFMKLRKGTI